MKGRYTGLLVEDSSTILLGLLGIMKSGNYVVPINPSFPDDRVRFIIEDCRLKVILTDKTNVDRVRQIAGDNTCLEHVICIDDIDFENESESLTAADRPGAAAVRPGGRTGPLRPEEPCYVIYTSGSTGNPKGVSITHRNLMPLLLWFHDFFKLGDHIKVLQNLSYTFDFGIFELLTTLMAGGALYFFNKKEVSDLNEYVDFIHRHQLDTIHTTPSFFTNIIGLGRPLTSLKLLHFGGETLTRKIVDDVSRQVGENCYIYNGYGPTETTINSSIFAMQVETGRSIDVPDSIPIGKPSANNVIYILDAYGKLQPIGIVGELYIGGGGVAGGYVNRPRLSAEKFIPDPFLTGEYMYRTGDLGRWLPDGNIEFLGRIDFQVKVRGFRIETGEIESWLLKYAGIKEAVVIARDEQDGENYLCGYLVAGAERPVPSIAELREFLSQNLPNYMIPSYFVFLDKIPLNPNGKVDRKALPEPETTGPAAVEFVPPRTRLEKKLAAIWAEVLKIDRHSIGIDSNFFELGGHSLKGTVLISKIHKQFDVSVKLLEIFRLPTIRELGPYLETAVQDTFAGVEQVEEKSYYPLSVVQERFFFFQQVNPDSISYNMYEIILVEGRLETDTFLENFKKLIHRHESLRTSFRVLDGRPVQKVHKSRDILCEIEDYDDVWETLKTGHKMRDNNGEENEHREAFARCITGIGDIFIRPFDLSCAPLLRFGLIRHEEEKHIFMVDMHHIISDGTSTAVFIGDFLSFYNGEELPPLRVRYRDYVYWLIERRREGRGSGREIDTGGENELLELPTDYMRPAVQSFEGAVVTFETGKEETRALNQLALKKETTLYMGLFSIFNIFLARLSGQENIIVGSPAAGRLQDDLEGIIGLFINTIAVRSYPAPDKRFDRFLDEVRENSLRALDEQEYQYEALVEKIEETRDSSRNPLFDVMLVLQNMDMPELEIPGFKIERNLQDGRAAKFDMTLYCEEKDAKLDFHLEYCTKLFKPGTIVRFIAYFKKILSGVLANPTIKIGEIDFISDKEKREILYDFNDKEVPYPRDKSIYQLFEEQAARTPEHPALIASGSPPFCKKVGPKTFPEGPSGHLERTPGSDHPKTFDEEQGAEVPSLGGVAVGRGGLATPGSDHPKTFDEGQGLTYRQLNERANRLARVLRAKGVKANAIVGIMLERSIELITALYAVLKAGGAYLPIDPEYPENRILSMLENSGAVMLLTAEDAASRKTLPAVSLEIVYVDEDGVDTAGQPGENLTPLSQPTDLIYVIFTSGSTGIPKGAGVYQRSFVNLMNWFVTDFALNESDRNLLMTSFSFDLTQKNLYASLILGGVLHLPAVNYFDPGEILRDIEENKVTWVNCTPSMFFQLIEFCKDDELKKLQSLRYVYLGGEPISISMFMKWLESEYCHGEIVNTYGPTECTDISNFFRIKEPHRYLQEAVPIGETIYNVHLAVVDRNLKLLPVGFAGELLIAGESVGAGYLNDRELTEEKFVTCSFEQGKPGRLYYRTGDLVKWLPEALPAEGAAKAARGGKIEFIGRMDYQVKIRGFRIEIGEIESRLLEHEAIKETIVMDRDDDSGGKYLCAYFVPAGTESPAAAELREYLSRSLPDYMIPSYFVQLEEMPLNPNGKVNRKALPEPEILSGKDYTAPRSDLEDKLARIWSEILGVEKGRIGIDDNFFELGGHSLKAAELTARLHQRLNVELDLKEIFRIFTIRGLAEHIGREYRSHYVTISSVEEKEYYPLSSAQERLYLLQRMNRENTAYNIPFVSLLEGDLDKKKLQDIFMRLIVRHESLRTTFHMLAEHPVQKIHKPGDIDFKIEYLEAGSREQGLGISVGARRAVPSGHASGGPLFEKSGAKTFDEDEERRRGRGEPGIPLRNHAEIIDRFVRPFDLSEAPLLRSGLFHLKEKEYILTLDIHHIISDGLSMTLFIKEFMSLYRGERLSPLRMRYRDYSQWQESRRSDAEMKDREAYWLEEFSGDIPVLDIPGDFLRPVRRNFDGNSISFEIDPDVTGKLHEMAVQEGVTLYMVLLALINILLSKLSGREEIIIGSPTAGRSHADLEPVIGVFINTLTLKNFPVGQKRFREFLKEVGSRVLSAFENQEYQFEDLVEQVSVQRDISRNPLFDVLFVMQDMDIPEVEMAGLKLRPFVYREQTAKFDITFNCEESAGLLALKVTYCTALFREETIAGYIEYFRGIVDAVLGNPDIGIGQIEILSPEEKHKILVDFNSSGADYPKDKTVHRLFEEQAERTPGRVALCGPLLGKERVAPAVHDVTKRHSSREKSLQENKILAHSNTGETVCLTYRELNEEAESLSGLLRQEGLMPGGIAAIDVERSVEMIVGLLAILKAGAAYLPLSPDYPEERKRYIIKDSGANISVTAEKFESRSLQGNRSYKAHVSYSALPGDPAYIMYTSGTTGRPKGVVVEHRSAVNIVTWFGREYGLRPGCKVLLMSAVTFDASVNQVFGTLLFGAELYVIPKHLLTDVEALYSYIKKERIHLIYFVPQLLRELLCDREKLEELEIVISGADKLENDLKDKILDKGYRLYNHYGPTETTVDALFSKCSVEKVTLGKPIANAACYILDRYGNMLPAGIPGELVVAGTGVARGYLNQPELTAEKFVTRFRIQDSEFRMDSASSGGLRTVETQHLASQAFPSHGGVPEGRGGLAPTSNFQLIYKTGDLARWLPDGPVEFLGRMDHQVKIRGFRIEVEEIENRLLDHEAIKEAVVIDRGDDSGEKYLCAYVVTQEPGPAAGARDAYLQEYLSGTLPEYMIPSYFVQVEKMPLNPNGKIDRKALPEPDISKLGSGYTPPRNELEKKLVEIWAEVLKTQPEHIGIDTHFFHAGGHSLRAAHLTARIYKEFAARIKLAEIFTRPTIRQLADTIAKAAKGTYFPLEAVEDKEYYSLSSAQKRLYILQRSNPEATGYNMPEAVELTGKLEKEKLSESFGELLRRHESLRTSFRMTAGEAKQFIHDPGSIEFTIEYIEAGSRDQGSGISVGARRAVPETDRRDLIHQIHRTVETQHLASQEPESDVGARRAVPDEIIESFIRPFDLSQAPLLRAGLIKTAKDKHILMVDMHHIISDGTSMGILIKDFMAIYSGDELTPVMIRYRDFSKWQSLRRESDALKKQGEYWLAQFAGDLPELELPTDYPDRDAGEESFAGDRLEFEIDREETQSLRQLEKEEKTTLFMVLSALYNVFLAKICSREEVVVGVPTAGRNRADLQHTIGMFVNTLALRNYPAQEKTFKEFLREVKERTLQALENQDYQFDDLVDRLGRSLFSVMFSLLNLDIPELEIPGLKLRPYPFRNRTSKFDLILNAEERGDRLRFIFEYNTGLFKEETIARFVKYFKEIMNGILKNRDIRLADIHISLDLSDSRPEIYREAAGEFEF